MAALLDIASVEKILFVQYSTRSQDSTGSQKKIPTQNAPAISTKKREIGPRLDVFIFCPLPDNF